MAHELLAGSQDVPGETTAETLPPTYPPASTVRPSKTADAAPHRLIGRSAMAASSHVFATGSYRYVLLTPPLPRSGSPRRRR